MGYMHIYNLYKIQDILLFKECWALEKLHGTSARVDWRDGKIWLSSGGESATKFAALFNLEELQAKFEALGHDRVSVYGEAYGGSLLHQSYRYGKSLRFTAFEVSIPKEGVDVWLSVPSAADVVSKLGLEFVHYKKISADEVAIDAERDAPSEQAKRVGIEGDQPREGVVLRPLIEFTKNDGSRIICKHKRDEEGETATPRKVVDPAQLEVLTKASEIAIEWVTDNRLVHVLDKLGPPESITLKRTGDVVKAMIEDVIREAAGEIVDSKEARTAIGKRASELFRARFKKEEAAQP